MDNATVGLLRDLKVLSVFRVQMAAGHAKEAHAPSAKILSKLVFLTLVTAVVKKTSLLTKTGAAKTVRNTH